LALAAAIPPLSNSEYEYLFTAWVKQYSKSYETTEFFGRYNTFKANLDMIREHNAKNESWTMGMNEFGDMTWEEFRAIYVGGTKVVPREFIRSKNTIKSKPSGAIPTNGLAHQKRRHPRQEPGSVRLVLVLLNHRFR